MKLVNGPFIAQCADRMGRKLTDRQIIHALDVLADEAKKELEKAQAESITLREACKRLLKALNRAGGDFDDEDVQFAEEILATTVQ